MKPAQAFHRKYTAADVQTYPGFGDAQFLLVRHGLDSMSPVVNLVQPTTVLGSVVYSTLQLPSGTVLVDQDTLLVQPPAAIEGVPGSDTWTIVVIA